MGHLREKVPLTSTEESVEGPAGDSLECLGSVKFEDFLFDLDYLRPEVNSG